MNLVVHCAARTSNINRGKRAGFNIVFEVGASYRLFAANTTPLALVARRGLAHHPHKSFFGSTAQLHASPDLQSDTGEHHSFHQEAKIDTHLTQCNDRSLHGIQ